MGEMRSKSKKPSTFNQLDSSKVLKLTLPSYIANLIEWGFSFFTQLQQQFNALNIPDDVFNVLITNKDYQLIQQLMLGKKKENFTPEQILHLFKIGDKCLVEGRARELILILLLDCVSQTKVKFLDELDGLLLWVQFEILFNHLNNGITLNKSAILLDGLVLDPEKKKLNFLFLKNFSSFAKQIELRNVVIDSVVIEALQSCLFPHLSALHLIDCPFNTTVCLNLSHLKQLTSFQCSNCYADQHLIQILDGVGENLVHLDISNNQLNPGEGQRLIEIIEKQSSLVTLNICGNNILPKSIPELFIVLFMLPALTSVDLSSNPIGPEFIRNLSDHFSVLYWTFLNLSNCCISDWDLKLFLNNFYKLPELRFLNISNNWIVDYPSSFCTNIKRLLSLEKITIGPVNVEKFKFPIDELLQIHPKLSFIGDSEILPKRQEELLLMRRVNLKSLDKLLRTNSSIEFSFPNVEHAKFDFTEFTTMDPQLVSDFFAKFTQLTTVELFYFDELSFELLLKIFRQNNIKNLTVSIGFGFRNIAQLFQLIDCCPNLSSLSLTKCYEINEKNYLKQMMERSGTTGSWKNLKRLSFRTFSYEFICDILSSLYLPSLTEFKMYNLVWDDDYDKRSKLPPDPLISIQSVSLFVNEWEASCYSDVVNLLRLFPNATRLDLHLNSNSRIKIPLFQLMPRLQTLSVYIYRMSGQEYISELIKLKHLTSLTFECLYYYPKNAEIKQDLSFPNLCQLKTHKAVFDCSNWVVPWLRKVSFQQCFSLPRLDKLSSFNLLKELVLEECTTEMLANLFAPNLFNNFSHLNSIRIGYDSNPSDIFETLTCKSKLASNSLVQLEMQFHASFIKNQMMNGNFPFLFVINYELFTFANKR